MLIKESLEIEVGNRIDFANDILKKEKIIKSVPIVYYSLRKYKNMGSYDILTDMSEHVTLLQLMDSLGNVNNAISVVCYWIFDSDYEISLVLNIESLDMIRAPSVGKEDMDTFETNFCAVKSICSTALLRKEWLQRISSTYDSYLKSPE